MTGYSSHVPLFTVLFFGFIVTLYRTPMKRVGNCTALSLRHMVYDIPTEYMSPFVTICVEVVRSAVCRCGVRPGSFLVHQ